MKYITVTLSFILILCSVSVAQINVSATANGTFGVSAYMTITKLADLDFGNMIKGANVTVASTDPRAAEFGFTGNANTVVDVTMTFPSVLTSGIHSMNFNEPNNSVLYNTVPNVNTANSFKGKKNWSARTGANGDLYIWAGGNVHPGNTQSAGTYTGVIQLVIVSP